MNAREIVAQQTDTSPDAWEYLEGPSSGVGEEYWLKNDQTGQEAYVCLDQGELISCEIN